MSARCSLRAAGTATAFFALSCVMAGIAGAFGPTSGGGPSDGQTNVPLDAYIDREFDLTLSGQTIISANVHLKANTGNTQDGAPTGSDLCTQLKVFNTSSPKQMIGCEHAPLSTETWYTYTITTGVKTSTGMALGANQAYRFRTNAFSGGGNFIPPATITNYSPRASATHPVNAKIRVYFRPGGNGTGSTMATSGSGSALHPSNVQLFVSNNGQPSGSNLLACAAVGGNPGSPTDCNMAWNKFNNELIITPGKKAPAGSVATTGTAMSANTQYVIVLKGGFQSQVRILNSDGAPLMLPGGASQQIIPFTATGSDSLGPTVQGSFPATGAASVDRAIYNISIGFTEPIDPSTVNPGTVKLYQDGGDGDYGGDDVEITGTTAMFDTEDNAASLSPNAVLASSTKFFFVATTGIKDLAGNSFDGDRSTGGNQDKVLSFTTGGKTNGQDTDDTKPTIVSANADNFTIFVKFSEPLKFNPVAGSGSTSHQAFDANNIKNWTVQSPPGVAVNMGGKSVKYVPSKLTVEIGNLAMPPNQEFLVKIATNTGAVKVRDLVGNTIDTAGTPPGNEAKGKVVSVLADGRPGSGEFDHSQNGQNRTEVMPSTPMASGSNVFYMVRLNTLKSIPSGGKVQMTFPTGFSFLSSCNTAATMPSNSDINGPGVGTVTIASVACSNTSRTVTVTTGGAQTGTSSLLNFMVQGVNNSTVPKDPSTSGYTVSVDTKDANGTVLESRTSMPFFLSQPGSQSIAGTVFKDNGAGGGTANNGIKESGESGVQNMKVCAMGFQGFNCVSTAANGTYTLRFLGDGSYKVMFPPSSSGSFIPQTTQQDVTLSGGQSKTNVNFPLTFTTTSITVSISGIPANTNLDVFAFNPASQGGGIVRTVTYGGATAEVTLPAPNGTYQVGIGPEMNKDPSAGTNTVPAFTFMPPQPQKVTVSGSSVTATFALQSASNRIIARVMKPDATGISNAFVVAKPQNVISQGIGGDGVTQSGSGGTASIPVIVGSYSVQAFVPGAPPSTTVSVEVRANADSTDGNSTADVYVNGALITASNPLKLVMTQGGLSISGKILDESGNAIPYAHVRAQKVDNTGDFGGRFVEAPANSAGSYTVYVDVGTWKVQAFAPGYGDIGSATVTVSSTNATQNIQVSGNNFGTITGTVKQNAVGVMGAFVNAFGTDGGNQVTTGTGGTFTMKVRAGTYTLEGFVPGYGPTTRLTSVAVSSGQTLTGKNLTLAQAGTIVVTISGVTDAFVEARDSNGQGNGTNTNTSGVYTITVPAGTYTVRAGSPSLGQIGSQSSVVVTGGSTTNVTLTPATTYTVSGTVSSSSTSCVRGVGVAFADSTTGRVIVSTTDSSGAFSLSLPAGIYKQTAGKPGCIDNDAPKTVSVIDQNVTSGVNRSLAVTSATITGNVTLDGVKTQLNAMVMGKNSDGKYVFAEVSSGSYTLNVTSGTWTVFVRSEGYKSVETTATAGGTADLTLSAISGYTVQEPTSTQVTPTAGGVVKNADMGSDFSVEIPASALSSTDTNAATITSNPTTAFVSETPTATVVGTDAVEISATTSDGQQVSTLNSNATIDLPYTAADLTAAGVTDESTLVIATWNDSTGQWESLSTTVDATNNVLTATTSHFSTFAAVAPSGGGSSGTSGGGGTTGGTAGGGGGGASGGRRIGGSTGGSGALRQFTTLPQVPRSASVVTPASKLQSARGLLKMAIAGKDVVFRDVPVKSWFASFVATVVQAGIASGYRDAAGNLTGQYGPGNNITYGEIAKMALGSAGHAPVMGPPPQNPTAAGQWSALYISLAEELGLSVYLDLPDVNQAATRGAVMQTMVEMLGITNAPAKSASTSSAQGSASSVQTGTGAVLTGTGSSLSSSSIGSIASTSSAPLVSSSSSAVSSISVVPDITFDDLSPSHPYAAAILLLAKLGVISGDTDTQGNPIGTVRPNTPINRAEVAKIFTKLIELKYVH